MNERDEQSLPIIEGNLCLISKEELEKLGKHELKWSNDDDGNPILVPTDLAKEMEKEDTLKRIAELKRLLSKTDYEAIKFAEGEISEEEFLPYKTNRRKWRAEINELQEKYNLE